MPKEGNGELVLFAAVVREDLSAESPEKNHDMLIYEPKNSDKKGNISETFKVKVVTFKCSSYEGHSIIANESEFKRVGPYLV